MAKFLGSGINLLGGKVGFEPNRDFHLVSRFGLVDGNLVRGYDPIGTSVWIGVNRIIELYGRQRRIQLEAKH
jgi:hypothetical protein